MPQVTQITLQKEPNQQQNTSPTLPTSAVDCYNMKGQNVLELHLQIKKHQALLAVELSTSQHHVHSCVLVAWCN